MDMGTVENDGVRNKKVILEMKGISKVFPGTVALENVNIEVFEGEVHGIIGKNGAGKSTLVNILSGILSPTTGTFLVNSKEFRHLSAARARREGITIVTQKPEIVPDFTVVQNLFLPSYGLSKAGLLDWSEMFTTARNIFEDAGIKLDPGRTMGDLSLDEQQVFLLLKAFYVDKQDLVLLDEVTTTFTKREQDFFLRLIDEQRKKGKSVIFISHRLDEVLEICDRITVIRDGHVVDTVLRSSADKELICSMIVGETSFRDAVEARIEKDAEPSTETRVDSVVLTVSNLTKLGKFQDVSFSLRKGEILGIAGLVGSGRTEILKAIAGIEPAEGGWIVLEDGKKTRFRKSWDAIKRGIVYLPEDREEEGLIKGLSVRKNLTVSYLVRLAKGFLVNLKKETNLIQKLIDSFAILTSSSEEEVQTLSGGNRQKVLFGRIVSTAATIFLLDEPTKGIDIGTKTTLLRTVRENLARNAGVVITSPGLEDLLIVCDRILVLFEGRISREFRKEEFDELKVYRAIQGMETSEDNSAYSERTGD